MKYRIGYILIALSMVGIFISPPISVAKAQIKTVSKATLKKKAAKADEKIWKIQKNNTTLSKSDTLTLGKTYTGTAYYVAEAGNDENDGLSSDTPWKTLEKVNDVDLEFGDAVFFKRGDTFRGTLYAKKGVSYSAYGTGEMPRVVGSPENGADSSKWTKYGETSDGGTVWVYYKDMTDCGCIYVNDKKALGNKITPNWDGKNYVTKSGKKFNVLTGLNKNLSFFTPADSKMPSEDSGFVDIGGSIRGSVGKLYFRCDKGNPGDVYKSIEFGTTPEGIDPIVEMADNSVINNLDIRYGSRLAVNIHDIKNAICQNCELSYCGGYILNYKNQVPERCGDGICASGRYITIKNCYVHDNWDNGITVENGYNGTDEKIEDFTISGNVVMRHAISALQFVSWNSEAKTVFKNITVSGNYLYESSEGWSYPFRADEGFDGGIESGSPIVIGDSEYKAYGNNFVLKNNVIYCKKGASIWGGIGNWKMKFKNNTFLFTSKKYPMAVLCPPSKTSHKWYWIKGKKEGVTLVNKKLGSGNKIFVGKG